MKLSDYRRLTEGDLGRPIPVLRVLDNRPLKRSTSPYRREQVWTLRMFIPVYLVVWGYVVFWLAKELGLWFFGLN